MVCRAGSGPVGADLRTDSSLHEVSSVTAFPSQWGSEMMKRCGMLFVLGLSACSLAVDQSEADQFCDHRAQFVDRLTGEKFYIDLNPLTESHEGWDLATALEWCDVEVLCIQFNDDLPEWDEARLPDRQIPVSQRRIIVDQHDRTVSGFASYRIYQPAGPGWELLNSVIIHEEWDGGSDDWTFFETSMVPVEGGGYIDRDAYFDAEGCRLRIPAEVELPSPNAPFPVRSPLPGR